MEHWPVFPDEAIRQAAGSQLRLHAELFLLNREIDLQRDRHLR